MASQLLPDNPHRSVREEPALECSGLCGEHHWLDHPESDTRECLICRTEVAD